jgi:hypothetical protein
MRPVALLPYACMQMDALLMPRGDVMAVYAEHMLQAASHQAMRSVHEQQFLAHAYILKTCLLYLPLLLLLQFQLLVALEQQEPASLAKVLLFYARLGPEHADLFQEVRSSSVFRQQSLFVWG